MEENIIKKLHPHPLRFFGFYFGGFALAIISFYVSEPMFWIGILVVVVGEITRRAETFYITDLGVSREYRFLSTSRQFAEYRRIQNIEVHQSILENIFGIGNIHFDTAGGNDTEIDFHGVKHPYNIDRIVRGKMITSA